MGDKAHIGLISFRLTPPTVRRIRKLQQATSQDDIPFNQMFEAWVEDLAQEYGIE